MDFTISNMADQPKPQPSAGQSRIWIDPNGRLRWVYFNVHYSFQEAFHICHFHRSTCFIFRSLLNLQVIAGVHYVFPLADFSVQTKYPLFLSIFSTSFKNFPNYCHLNLDKFFALSWDRHFAYFYFCTEFWALGKNFSVIWAEFQLRYFFPAPS